MIKNHREFNPLNKSPIICDKLRDFAHSEIQKVNNHVYFGGGLFARG